MERREELTAIDQRIEALKQRRSIVAGVLKDAARKRDTRRKIIVGAKLLARRETDDRARDLIDEMLDELTETEKPAFVDWSP